MTAAAEPTRRVLVTGGVRSGKSRYAEACFASEASLTYLTPGYPAEPEADPEWAARVAAHRARRPSAWRTVETVDLASALAAAEGPVLVDCLGVWVTRIFDSWQAWEQPSQEWRPRFEAELVRLLEAVRAFDNRLVIVTNEVGWGVVPAYPAGRLFADSLGSVNSRMAEVVDQVVLMVSGRPLILPER